MAVRSRSGPDQQRDPVAATDSDLLQASGQRRDPGLQLGERGDDGAGCRQLDGRHGRVLAAIAESRPQRRHRRRRHHRRQHRRRQLREGLPGRSTGQILDPLPRVGGGGRRVLGDQVRSAGVAVHVGVREPVQQIGEIGVGEHRIPRPPQQEDRDLAELREPGDHRLQARPARVVGFERDVGDEVPDRPPPVRRAVRRSQGRTHLGRQCRPRHRAGAPDEGGRGHADGAAQQLGAGQPDQSRSVRSRYGDAGVGQDDAAQLPAVPERPAESDGTAPVVGDQHHGAVDAQGVGEPVEVVDPLGHPPRSATRRAFRPPHPQLVGCDHPPPRRRGGEEPPPQVGPGGVAVQAQHRAAGRLGTVVEEVPATHRPGRIRHQHPSGPGRVDPRQSHGWSGGDGWGLQRRHLTRRSRRTRC